MELTSLDRSTPTARSDERTRGASSGDPGFMDVLHRIAARLPQVDSATPTDHRSREEREAQSPAAKRAERTQSQAPHADRRSSDIRATEAAPKDRPRNTPVDAGAPDDQDPSKTPEAARSEPAHPAAESRESRSASPIDKADRAGNHAIEDSDAAAPGQSADSTGQDLPGPSDPLATGSGATSESAAPHGDTTVTPAAHMAAATGSGQGPNAGSQPQAGQSASAQAPIPQAPAQGVVPEQSTTKAQGKAQVSDPATTGKGAAKGAAGSAATSPQSQGTPAASNQSAANQAGTAEGQKTASGARSTTAAPTFAQNATRPSAQTASGAAPITAKVTVEVASPSAASTAASASTHTAGQTAAHTGTQNGSGSAGGGQQPSLATGSGQPLFVGANQGSDGGQNGANGQQAQNGGQNGGQNTGGQNSGGQNSAGQSATGQAAQPAFQFGQATIGQRGFGGEAARAQFQAILETRTARVGDPLSNRASSSSSTGQFAQTLVSAGQGGPQSILATGHSRMVASATPGRSGVTPGSATDQVSVKLSQAGKDGGGKISIRLNPEELGKVDVKMEIGRDGMVRALVSADRPETLDMLQRDSRALEKALQDAGLKTDSDSLQFERGDKRHDFGKGSDGSSDHPAPGKDSPAEIAEGGAVSGDETEPGLSDDGSLNLVA